MSESEKLRALLAEARREIATWHLGPRDPLVQRIDAALAEPVEGCGRCETLRGLADTAAAEQGLAQRRMMEAQKQRDEARAEVARLRWANEMGCENTPTKGCECPGCGLARERAERGEGGP